MKLSYYGRVAYARTIAGAFNLSLVESVQVKTPCTDGLTLWVPPYELEWEEDSEKEVLWWGKLCHEVYHNDRKKEHHLSFRILHARTEQWKKEGKVPSKLWKAATNLLEDLRIEKREYGEYPGQDRIMERLRSVMMRDTKKYIAEEPKKNDVLFIMQYLGFAKFNKGCIGEPVLGWTSDTIVTEAWAKIEDLMPRIYAMDHVNEPYELADEIVRRLTEDDEDEGGPDKGQTRPKNTADEGTGDGEGEGEEGEGGKDEGEEKTPASLVIHDHGKPPPHTGLPKFNDATWKYRDSPHEGDFTGIPMTEIRTKGMDHGNSSGLQLILENTKTQGLAAQIRKQLLVMSARRYVGGHKRGKLDGGALWKGTVYRNTEAGKRVFKQKDDVLSLDCAVTLLIDQSGSMASRRKIIYASAAACALNEVFDKIGVKCRVAGFTDSPEDTINYLHKEFDEHLTTYELASRLAQSQMHRMSGNADGENILWEYEKLVVRQETKKVFIVLSDGMPADSKAKYNVTVFTKRVTSNIERQGKVRLIGVGILDGSVQDFYKHYEIINDASHIEEVVLRLLQKEIINE